MTIPIEKKNKRNFKILEVIIYRHIKYHEFVSSNLIAKTTNLKISPATIRNIMSELERKNLLKKTHSYSGRIPTQKAYRIYIDHLLTKPRFLTEKINLNLDYLQNIKEIEELINELGKLITMLTNQTGFIVSPDISKFELESIKLLPLQNREILVIIITKNKFIKHKILKTFMNLDQKIIEKLNEWINEIIKKENLSKLINEIKDIQLYDKKQKLFYEILKKIFHKDSHIYIQPAFSLFEQPYKEKFFNTIKVIKNLIWLLREKNTLQNTIKKISQKILRSEKPIDIKIGYEFEDLHMKNLSLISEVYRFNKIPAGTLGILGPVDMDYKKNMEILNTFVNIIERKFNN